LQRKQARRDWNLRIWSAGCSTGQEPFTLAMMVADALAYYYLRNPLPFDMPSPKPLIPPPWKVEILASDINYSVLRAGQEGIYLDNHMESVDYTYRLRYFRQGRPRALRHQTGRQRAGAFRFSQPENGIFAAA